MDITTLGAAIAIAKTLPDTASGRAEAAAQRAEAAAEVASESAIRMSISGTTLTATIGGEE